MNKYRRGQETAWGLQPASGSELLWSMWQGLRERKQCHCIRRTIQGKRGKVPPETVSSSLDLSVLAAFLLAELCPKRLRAEDLTEVVPIFFPLTRNQAGKRLRTNRQRPTHRLLKERLFHDLHIVFLNSCSIGLVPSAVKSL